ATLPYPAGFGFANSFSPGQGALESMISANGRYLVVGAQDPCLFFDYCPGEALVRCDLQYGTNELISSGSANYSAPTIDSAGKLVAFHTVTLIGGTNVFLRNMASSFFTLLSVNRQGTAGGNSFSINPIFSPDDRWVMFASAASDLTTNATSGSVNLFARDLFSNTTRMISVGADGVTPLGYSGGAVFSADSRHIAYLCSNSTV